MNETKTMGGSEIKTLISFSGADFVVTVNSIVYGELYCLDYDSTRTGEELILNFAVFDNSICEVQSISPRDHATVIQVYADEYGNSLVRKFFDIAYVGERYKSSIDDKTITTNFVFSCKHATRFEKVSPEEIRKILGTDKHV